MKKLLATLLLLVALAFGGWYFASPYFALKGLKDAVAARDMAEIEERVDFPALRVSAAEQLAKAVQARIDEGALLDALRGAASEILQRASNGETLAAKDVVDALLTENLAQGLLPAEQRGHPIDFDIEREGLDHFRAVGVLEDGTPGPALLFTRDGLGWKLTGFELPALR